jgi:hypothetical protein
MALTALGVFTAVLVGESGGGANWQEQYGFTRSNSFKIEFYAKKGELMRTVRFTTLYREGDSTFSVRQEADRKGAGMQTVIDKKNMTAIQMFGTGGGAVPMCNAGAFRYPDADKLKKLDIIPAEGTKTVAGKPCRRYTYTYKKIFGEVWITDQVSLPNDLGIFRAGKMAALHNTLSVPGFVMEMTTEDKNGGKTLMTTESLQNEVSDTVSFKGIEVSKAINAINYFTF